MFPFLDNGVLVAENDREQLNLYVHWNQMHEPTTFDRDENASYKDGHCTKDPVNDYEDGSSLRPTNSNHLDGFWVLAEEETLS